MELLTELNAGPCSDSFNHSNGIEKREIQSVKNDHRASFNFFIALFYKRLIDVPCYVPSPPRSLSVWRILFLQSCHVIGTDVSVADRVWCDDELECCVKFGLQSRSMSLSL